MLQNKAWQKLLPIPNLQANELPRYTSDAWTCISSTLKSPSLCISAFQCAFPCHSVPRHRIHIDYLFLRQINKNCKKSPSLRGSAFGGDVAISNSRQKKPRLGNVLLVHIVDPSQDWCFSLHVLLLSVLPAVHEKRRVALEFAHVSMASPSKALSTSASRSLRSPREETPCHRPAVPGLVFGPRTVLQNFRSHPKNHCRLQ